MLRAGQYGLDNLAKCILKLSFVLFFEEKSVTANAC